MGVLFMLRQCYYKGRWYENLLVTEQGIVYRRDGDKLTELTHYYDGEVFDAIIDAANKYCISAGNIGRVCDGKRKTCGGYHWRYLD